jgi:hypothetical protein
MKCRVVAGLVLAGFMFSVAGCQSGGDGGILGFGGNKKAENAEAVPEGKILQSELLAYCPKVTLREGTAYFNTYAKGAEDDAGKIIYQGSISDVTRSCTRANGLLTMNVAVAGRFVPGPVGTTGTATAPIRIVVVRGEEILYSQLHSYKVAIGSTGAATQFVFNDPNVTVPIPANQDLQVYAGFDEGPAKKKKNDDEAF